MSEDSVIRSLFDRWERVWHQGRYDLVAGCLAPIYIRHDNTRTRAGMQLYQIEGDRLAGTWLTLLKPGSAWPDATAQEHWTSKRA